MEDSRENISIMILENQANYAIELQGILFQAGFSEVFTFGNNQAAEAWLARHTPDIAILTPRLSDGSCRGVVTTLTWRRIPYIVYSELRPGAGSWLLDGRWISKPCVPHVIISAVGFAVAQRQIQTKASAASTGPFSSSL